MSDDFLSKFSKDTYQKGEEPNKPLDSQPTTLKRIREEDTVFVREEEAEVDPTYKKRKTKRNLLIGLVLLIVAVAVGIGVYFVSTVVVDDFVGLQVSEARRWSQQNQVELQIESVFSLEQPTNTVLEQSIAPNTRISKKEVILLQVSKGLDPEEIVAVPDFKNSDVQLVYDWMDANKLDNISFQRVYSDTVAENNIIDITFNDRDVTSENYRRKNRMTVTLSLGQEVFEKTITVIDFKEKTEGDVRAWHTEQKFNKAFIFTEAYDDKVAEGMIVSQSISPNSLVSREDIITFVVSKGKATIVPNYSHTNKDTFGSVNSEVNATQLFYYHASVHNGYFLWQSIAAGTNVSDDPMAQVKVAYSLGRPYIGNEALNLNPKAIEELMFGFNSKGTNISYEIKFTNLVGCQEGVSYNVSKMNQYLNMTDHLVFHVGRGCPVEIVETP